MFHPSEVELGATIKTVLAEAEKSKPTRLVFDSLSELRLIAQSTLRYRRQILALKQFFSRQQCTVLFIDDKTNDERDMHLHSIAHGVISLERQTPPYGAIRRRLQVTKLRGRDYRTGSHDCEIKPGGVEVYPRLVAAEHLGAFGRDTVKSGLQPLDALLGGGLARGEHATLFLFDETIATFHERMTALGMDVQGLVAANRVTLRQVDPAELSPGEFSHVVCMMIEQAKSRIVVIDSLNGYLNAMPSERFLNLHLHELLTFLGQQGVTTLLVMAQHGLVGASLEVPVDTSYVADTVLLMRYFEAAGEVRKAISVIKKRTGQHERTIREVRFGANGITIGEPLREFQGVLTGTPSFVGAEHNGVKRSDECAR
jgi:circadian clock protein KaiC